MPLPAFFVGRWLLAEQPEIRMQWFAFVSLLHWTLNAVKLPTAHVHRDMSTTFHVTTQHREKQRLAVTSLFCRSLVVC